jgi:hypothetical protein
VIDAVSGIDDAGTLGRLVVALEEARSSSP